jgi:Cof subfamily protein (haloacid dehalogenase superfamily)
MIKHVFLDLDGTLLNDSGTVSKENQKLICSSRLPVTLVSGRSPVQMLGAMSDLNLKTPQVAYNGGLIFKIVNKQPQELASLPLDKKIMQTIINFVRTKFPTVTIALFDLNHFFTPQLNSEIVLLTKLLAQTPTQIDLTPNFWQQSAPLYKITLSNRLHTETIPPLLRALESLHLPNVAIVASDETCLDITHSYAQKNVGVDYILKHHHLSVSETAAFGNGLNDLSMFKAVGLAIAMQNSPTSLKQQADQITLSNEANGVGYGIEHYILNQHR